MIIKQASITEKSLRRSDSGQYTFVINAEATKDTIAHEIERVFKVNVVRVRTLMLPGKQKRRGKSVGQRSVIHKAIVTLKKGQKIPEYTVSE